MHVRLAVAVSVVGLTFLTGCPSASTMGLARPLRKGSMQMVVAPEVQGLGVGTPAQIYLPQAELGVRYGVTDNFEFGGRVWLVGLGLESKIGLMEAPTLDTGIDLALAPGVSYWGINIPDVSGVSAYINSFTFHLPLLVGVNMGGHQLVLAPKVIDNLLLAGGSAGGSGASGLLNIVHVGGSVGYAIKVSDEFRIQPEISVTYPLAAFGSLAGTSSGGLTNATTVTIQAGVGLLFGGRFENAPETVNP